MSSSRKNYLEVYTDGSCAYNGQGGARAGAGAYFPNCPEL